MQGTKVDGSVATAICYVVRFLGNRFWVHMYRSARLFLVVIFRGRSYIVRYKGFLKWKSPFLLKTSGSKLMIQSRVRMCLVCELIYLGNFSKKYQLLRLEDAMDVQVYTQPG